MPKKTNYLGAIYAINIVLLKRLLGKTGNAITVMPVKNGLLDYWISCHGKVSDLKKHDFYRSISVYAVRMWYRV